MNKTTLTAVALSVALLCTAFTSRGQVEKAKQSMMNIYKAYDSLKYLSFDVKYEYNTDTLQGDFSHDELKGTYSMHGKNAVYTLGDIDFMQNDSFLIAVYNKEKFMIVSDPQLSNAGVILPMHEQIDSLFRSAAANYTVTVTTKRDITAIAMVAKDKLQSFNKFIITYDNNHYYLISLQYSFIGKSDRVVNDTEGPPQKLSNILRKKSLSIKFSNYKFDNFSSSLYDEKKYIFFEQNIYKPTEQYKEFKVYYSKIKNKPVFPFGEQGK